MWNICLEQSCAAKSFWSHGRGDAQRVCGAAVWDVPSLSGGSDLSPASQNVSPGFEDQVFKTGI